MKEKDLIWVDKEFAARYKALEEEQNKAQMQSEILEEYLQKVSAAVRNEFKCNLEALEEDAAIYSGLMLKVRQSFEKAKNEALDASYALWESYDKELPSVEKKVSDIVNTLKPLTEELKTINSLLNSISTYSFERVSNAINSVVGLDRRGKEMFDFLINNFKQEKPNHDT